MRPRDSADAAEVTARVAEFYSRHPFPGERRPDADGLLLMRRVASLLGGVRPRPDGAGPRLLDAGCGTGNTAVALARAFPWVEVRGVDICEASLERARAAADAARLANLRFERADLLAGPPAGGPWDVVVCLGVVHHTADMGRALAALAAALAPHGRLLLWVYGRHGRHLHDLNRRLLAMLLTDADGPAERLALARAFALGTGDAGPLRDLYGFVPGPHEREQVVLSDAWIADQFLHVNERAVDLPELLDLLEGAGLALQEWLGTETGGRQLPVPLAGRLAALPRRERLGALDLLLRPRRYFVVARRKDG